VAVLIRNVNQAPTASAGATQTVAEGALVTLDGGLSADPAFSVLASNGLARASDPVTVNVIDPGPCFFGGRWALEEPQRDRAVGESPVLGALLRPAPPSVQL
jgi:hypothetical protein